MKLEAPKNLVTDLIETALNNVTNNSFLNDVPIISTITNIYKSGQSISDHLLTKKILTFLNALQETSHESQIRIVNKIENDEKFRDRLGLQLLEILNRNDDHEKPKLIAKLFKAYIIGEIDIDLFYKFSQIINNAYYADLIKLSKMPSGITEAYEVNSLLALGLIELKSKHLGNTEILGGIGKGNKIEYVLNKYGQELAILIR